MNEYQAVLRRCSLFAGIADADLSALLGCLQATVKSYHKGETILCEGDAATHIGMVLSGEVQICQVDFYGNRSIVSEVHPSELFGESFACAEVDSIPVDVVADKDSEILFIERGRITRSCCNACAFHQQMIYNLMRDMAAKNLMFHQKIQITSKRTTREKLIAYLLHEAKRHSSDRFEIPFDRQELADYLEVDRSGLSVEIGKLRKEGYIEAEKKRFVLLKELL